MDGDAGRRVPPVVPQKPARLRASGTASPCAELKLCASIKQPALPPRPSVADVAASMESVAFDDPCPKLVIDKAFACDAEPQQGTNVPSPFQSFDSLSEPISSAPSSGLSSAVTSGTKSTPGTCNGSGETCGCNAWHDPPMALGCVAQISAVAGCESAPANGTSQVAILDAMASTSAGVLTAAGRYLVLWNVASGLPAASTALRLDNAASMCAVANSPHFAALGMQSGAVALVSEANGNLSVLRVSTGARCVLRHVSCAKESVYAADDAGNVYRLCPAEARSTCLGSLPGEPRVFAAHEGGVWAAVAQRTAQRRSMSGPRKDAFGVVRMAFDGTVSSAEASSGVVALAVLPDGRCATALTDSSVCIWGFGTPSGVVGGVRLVHRIARASPSAVASMAASVVDGSTVLWLGLASGAVRVIAEGQAGWYVLAEWRTGAVCPIDRMAIGQQLLTSSSQAVPVVRVWDASLRSLVAVRRAMHCRSDWMSERKEAVAACTWNVAGRRPSDISGLDASFWREWICGPPGRGSLTETDAPTVVVFGLQEIVNLEGDKAGAAASMLSRAGGEGPRVHGGTDAAWLRVMETGLTDAFPGVLYTLVASEVLVGLFLAVYVRDRDCQRVSAVAQDRIPTGLGGLHGNKGGLLLRLAIDSTTLCIANCHLPSGSEAVGARNAALATVLDTASFPSVPRIREALDVGLGGSSTPLVLAGDSDGRRVAGHEWTLVLGDLNYRLGAGRRDAEDMVYAALSSTEPRAWDRLAACDQLLRQLRASPWPSGGSAGGKSSIALVRAGDTRHPLAGFAEGVLRFAPTYKYDAHSDVYDTSDKMRVPSYCDRVLVRGPCGLQPSIVHYGAVQSQRDSDHRPVSALMLVPVRSIDVASLLRVTSDSA